MNARKLALIAMLFALLAVSVAACAPAPTTAPPPPAPTVAPMPTAVPATAAPKPTAVPPTAVPAAAFDIKSVLDKYFTALPDGYYNLAPAAANDQMKATKTFLIDVREVSEITSNGYIEGEVNIPVRTLIKNLDKLPADKAAPIIVTCGSGVRSPMAMEALQLLGYTNVKNLQGGFNGWKAANLPIKTDGQPAAPVAGTAPTVDKELVAALDKFFSGLPDGYNNVAPATINDQMKATKVTLIDVREASEFATGYIEGSVNVPVRTIIKSDKLPADKTAPIVITCASGHRGMMSIMALQLLGYTNVKNISGGVNAWKAANLPVVGAPTAAAFDVKAALDKYLAGLPDGFGTIAPAAAKDQMAATKVFVMDVREVTDMASGYIEGAVNIPVRSVMKNLDKLPAKDQPIIVTCASGHRGSFTMAALQALGYTNVKSMAGGINAWKAANLPLKTEGAPAAPMAGTAASVDKDLLAAFDKWFSALPDGFSGIAPAAAKDQMAATKVVLIDVREVSEFNGGYVEGSINVPIRTLLKSDKLPADKAAPVIVTCASGHRGGIAMMALQMLGYTNVKSMLGGVNAWKTANLPVLTK
jgi:rhodanese-related sulfurtransferase